MKFIELEYYEWQAYTDGIQITHLRTNKVAINIFNIASIEEVKHIKNFSTDFNYTLIHTVSGKSYLVNKSYSNIINLLK